MKHRVVCSSPYVGKLHTFECSVKQMEDVQWFAEVKASIIHGSGLGPASFTVTTADLHPVRAENRIFKFADDTYLAVPASNILARDRKKSFISKSGRRTTT